MEKWNFCASRTQRSLLHLLRRRQKSWAQHIKMEKCKNGKMEKWKKWDGERFVHRC